MHERQPAFRVADSLARHATARRQLADQVEDLSLSLGWVRKDLLVQPFHRGGIEPLGPALEEQEEKVLEEKLDQDLEALVVVHEAAPSAAVGWRLLYARPRTAGVLA